MNKLVKAGLSLMLAILFLFPASAFADAQAGDVIVTLGKNLTAEQRAALLNEMGVNESADIVEVTNEEEHQYLGSYISSRLIGTKALSSSKIEER